MPVRSQRSISASGATMESPSPYFATSRLGGHSSTPRSVIHAGIHPLPTGDLADASMLLTIRALRSPAPAGAGRGWVCWRSSPLAQPP